MDKDNREADFSQIDSEIEDDISDSNASLEGESKDDCISVENQDQGDIAKLRREAEEFKDKYLRALADFENYKKRAMKERSELLKYQGEKLVVDFLEIADNLERASKEGEKNPDSLKEGLPLILKLLNDTFAKWEIRPISGVGQPFDPNRFQAISRAPSDALPPGTILNELRKSYLFKDKLIRAGEVVVVSDREETGKEEQKEI
jgi:molecular chaperone GrpE